MKKIFTIILVMFFSFGFSQDLPTNRFDETDQEYNRQYEETPTKEPEVANSPGNPGEPVPINDHLPLLFLTAAGVITYTAWKKNKALS